MKKTVWRTSIAKVMAVIMVISLAGCEKKGKQDNADILEMTYEGTAFVADGMEGDPVSCYVRNGRVYILTDHLTEDDSTDEHNEHTRLYSVYLDGSNVQEIPINLSKKESIVTFLAEKDGTLLCLMVYDEKEPYNELVRYDADGKELLRENITKSLNLSANAGVSGIVEDGKGNVVVADERKVYILNKELQSVGEVELGDDCQVMDMALTKDGQILCVEDENRNDHQMSWQIQILDVEGKKWGDSLKLDTDPYLGSDFIMDGSEYDFYYKDSFGIYGYDIASKKGIKLLDYAASYLTSEDADSMVSAGGGDFIGIAYDRTQNRSILEIYSKADPAAVASRQIITYAAYGVSDATKRAAMKFNQKNRDYKIEFKDYTDEEDPSAKMLTDIMAGNVPDIISISILPISAEQCVEKGLLEDLTPYYEKDPLVQTNDIIHSVLEAMKIDGKLYYVTPYFSIKSIVGKTKDVGTGTGWTLDELKALLDKKGEGVIPFDTESKTDMLSDFLGNGITDFVNWQTGECSFDSQEFKDILEICNRGIDEEIDFSEEGVINTNSMLREGKILLSANFGYVSLEEVQLARQVFGEDITYIGYPNQERQGSYFEFFNQVGIYSKSNVKEQAWEFIRSCMTKEYQGIITNVHAVAMPTRQDCFDMRVKAMTATEAYVDDFGQEIEPLEQGSRYIGDLKIQYGPVSQKDVDIYVNLVNQTKKSVGFDEEMMKIVFDEAKIYFAGRKSLDKTVQIIQKRVQTYVNENR